ncbi:MAG: metallophosphoesterase family protein [Patescibacteria group bacterium]
MKMAFISDIHGNLTALETVLADIKSRGADEIICLGDVVGYGPHPQECLRIVRENCTVAVLGNHDAAVIDPAKHLPEMGRHAQLGMEYTLPRLDDDDRAYLRELPTRLHLPDFGLCLAHGSFVKDDVWTYVENEHLIKEEFAGMPENGHLNFCGHTHVPLVFGERTGLHDRLTDRMPFDANERFVINVGSVGQPRDGDCRARYGLLEIEEEHKLFTLVYVFYDIARTGRDIDTAGLPLFLHERLYCGE